MIDEEELEMGQTYQVTIDQRGHEYTADIEVEMGVSPYSKKALTVVRDSNYPNRNWHGKVFELHSDGIVTEPQNPFDWIGTVVDIEEL